MDGFIEAERQAGSYDSTGRFTLDLPRAWKKLAQFRFANPDEYLLFLVRSAVGSGASYLHVELGLTSTRVVHDGAAAEPAQLEQLFEAPFQPAAPRWLQELAVGLHHAPCSRLVLETPQGRLGFDPARLRAEVAAWSAPSTTLRLIHSPNPFRLARQRALLQGRCRLSPIPLTVNGADVRRLPEPGGPHVCVRPRAGRVGLPLPLPARGRPLETELNWHAVVSLAGGRDRVQVVVRGVLWETDPPPLLFSGVRAWISVPDLELGLGGEPPAAPALGEHLNQWLLALALGVWRQLPDGSVVELLRALPDAALARDLARELAGRLPRDHSGRAEVLAWLVWFAILDRDEPTALQAFHELMQEPPFDRLEPLSRVVPHLLEDGRPDEAAAWLDRLLPVAERLEASAPLVRAAVQLGRAKDAERLGCPGGVQGMLERLGVRSGALSYSAELHVGQILELSAILCRHQRCKYAEQLLAQRNHRWSCSAPLTRRIRAAAAQELLMAVLQDRDHRLRQEGPYAWKEQRRARAMTLYAELLEEAPEPQLLLARAVVAAAPVEGLARTQDPLLEGLRRVVVPLLKAAREGCAGTPFFGPAALLELEVRAELGQTQKAERQLAELEELEWDGGLAVQRAADRLVLQALSRQPWEPEPLLERLRTWVGSELSADPREMGRLYPSARALPEPPLGLCARLVRAAELGSGPEVSRLLQYALLAHCRATDSYRFDPKSVAPVALRLMRA